MKRFAIYARYSSHHQKETSIDDQIRECSDWVATKGGTVVKSYKDSAASGAHFINRPEIQTLLADAERGLFDAVITEDLSRLSRDQEHIAGFYKRLQYNGVVLYTLSDNEITALHIGLKGTVNHIYLADLADKTRRGQKGAVARGKIPGGISYGYKRLKKYDENGELIPGLREIDPEQAKIIQRIFREYLLGKSAKAIAADLNKEHIPSPRGGQWMASTINGNPARQNGILCNMLYNGKIAYNRQRFIKNPDTGKRKAIMNPREEWVINEVKDFQIIDDATWHKVQAMKKAIAGKPKSQQRRKKHLLSGLIRCGVCGGSYTVYGTGRYSCSHRRERGTCENGKTITIRDVEQRIIKALSQQMFSEEMLEAFTKGYNEALQAERHMHNQRLQNTTKQLKTVSGKIESIIQAVMDGLYSPSMKETLSKLEHEKEALVKEIAYLEQSNVITIQPKMSKRYKQEIEQLLKALQSDSNEMREAANVLRSLIHRIVVIPQKPKGEYDLRLEGDLARILQFASGKEVLPAMVAGGGFSQYQYKKVITVMA